MAKFSVGDRVRVPDRDPEVEVLLWGQLGTVTSVGPPLRRAGGGESGQPDVQQYVVRFDGLQGDREVYESWIEPALSDQQ